MDIVMAKFQSKYDKDKYEGNEYSYYTAIPLNVGDIVTVPTQKGTGKAQVSRVNVRDSEINFDPRKLKTIEAFAEQKDTSNNVPAMTATTCQSSTDKEASTLGAIATSRYGT